MDAAHFCGEYGKELPNGQITFSKAHVKKFIDTYTYSKYEDFTPLMIEKLKHHMIELYNSAISGHHMDEQPAVKIELPLFIFQ